MAWGEEVVTTEGLNGERRADRRYDIALELRWKLIRRRRVIDTGVGRTIDLSSGGILFETGRELPVGLNVELSIQWPVRLHNVAPLQLIVSGKIVRAGGGWAAIRTVQHEFRTMGVSQENRPTLAAAARAQAVFQMGSYRAPSQLSKMN
jgi:hypothetical protein